MDRIKTKNRIAQLFETKNSGILSVYYTAGFPKLDDTFRVAQLLEQSGADMIEIGIPFSDPIADGPVIQQSNKVALENGMNLKLLLDQVKEIRKTVQLPIILMGYLNPILQYGMERFANDASSAGVDGVIIPDLPIEEYSIMYKDLFEEKNLVNTLLIAPNTSEERIRKIDAMSDGFIYVVSASGTTGVKSFFSHDQLNYFRRLKDIDLKNPILIGFGISTKFAFDEACRYGAGAIIGSAFIEILMKTSNIDQAVKEFMESIRTKKK